MSKAIAWLEDYLQDYGGWFARERILTKQKTFLATDSKVISFGLAKDILRHKFKEHDLWKRDETGLWTEMRSDFKKESDRMRMNDDNIAQERKSKPLYRDVSSSGQSNFVRTKYAGLDVVDLRTVAMSILRCGDRQSSQFLLEFNICRSAVGRGGEHPAIHWDGGNWDWFFQAADIDWKISKQLDRQCMLFFHDVTLYCLDVYLSFAVYFFFRAPSSAHDAGSKMAVCIPVLAQYQERICGRTDDEPDPSSNTQRNT